MINNINIRKILKYLLSTYQLVNRNPSVQISYESKYYPFEERKGRTAAQQRENIKLAIEMSIELSIVEYNTVQYGTVQYSTGSDSLTSKKAESSSNVPQYPADVDRYL